MGAAATGSPVLPSGYVAGTITISGAQADQPQQLLALIQVQLDPNCPGAAYTLTIQIDTTPIYGGRQNAAGALSSSNYGWTLQSNYASRAIQSAFPGVHAPIGDIEIYMAAGTFHVEVIA